MPKPTVWEGIFSEGGNVEYCYGVVNDGFWKGKRVRALKSSFKPSYQGAEEPTRVAISLAQGRSWYFKAIEEVDWDNSELNTAKCDCGFGETCRVCESDNQPPLDVDSGLDQD